MTITITDGLSIFLCGQKDSKLQPCQDYWYLNEHTVKNAYPLPCITELLNKLKGAKYFTKLDVRWGYNNVRIKDRDQWKAAFKMNRGLFEPTVMFFGLCNSPATFQAMILATWLMKALSLFIWTTSLSLHRTRPPYQRTPEGSWHDYRKMIYSWNWWSVSSTRQKWNI